MQNIRYFCFLIANIGLAAIPLISEAEPVVTGKVTETVADKVTLQGKLQQGALIRGYTVPGTQVWLNGSPLRINAAGQFAFGFDRDAALTQQLQLHYPDGQQQVKPLTLSQRQYKIQQVQGIAQKIMEPNPEDVARAAKDTAEVKVARGQVSDNGGFASSFIWPLTGRISGVYGSQRVYNGKPGTPHYGVDIAAKRGTVVVAPADGVISLAVPDMFYSGGTLIIDHGLGVSSSFLHLSKLYLNVGDSVKQGQPVAEVGATGRANGPHLDWRINWFQMRLDAATVVPEMASK